MLEGGYRVQRGYLFPYDNRIEYTTRMKRHVKWIHILSVWDIETDYGWSEMTYKFFHRKT